MLYRFFIYMNKDDYLKKFKQECRSYHYYQGRIEKIDQKITLLDLKMRNVQSPKLEKIGQSPSRHELSYPALITKKEKLQKDRDYYQEHLDWIKETVDSIPSPAYRSVTWYSYVDRKGLHEIAEFHNVSKDMLYRKRKRFVMAALTDERMQKLEEIEQSEQLEEQDPEKV